MNTRAWRRTKLAVLYVQVALRTKERIHLNSQGVPNSYVRFHRLKTLRRGKNRRLLQVLRDVEAIVRVHLSLNHLRKRNGVRVENERIARLHPLGTAEVLQLRFLASLVLDQHTLPILLP